MIADSLKKLKWGFFFIMIGFRIQGIDIFPDVIGHILFAIAFYHLRNSGSRFNKAFMYNIPLIFTSLFSIYQAPAQQEGIQFERWGWLGIIVSIVSFILNLLTVYNLFMGIREMEESFGNIDLADESEKRWNNYLMLQIAVMFSFLTIFIPFIAFFYVITLLIVAVMMLIRIMNFLKRCIDSLDPALKMEKE